MVIPDAPTHLRFTGNMSIKAFIPTEVSDRQVTPRGVHLHPGGTHNAWMPQADYWLGLLVEMHISWVLAISASDNFRVSGAAEALLQAGIIPIVRFLYQFPDPWTHGWEVRNLARLYERYGAPLIVQFANEPYDDREWRTGRKGKSTKPKDPEQFWQTVAGLWNAAAQEIVSNGGIAGFPDGPCYDRNPFLEVGDPNDYWERGKAVYLGHFYGKGRPVDYPYDDVSQRGTPLTEEEYREALDDYADDPAWRDIPLGTINEARRRLAKPGLTAIQDDTCWRGWEKVRYWSEQAFGFAVPMAMTEGGWVPRDRAGSGSDVDLRWPLTTPKAVARLTLEMETENERLGRPLFAHTPWLLADREMGGADGWPFDAWVGWAYSERYGMEKPVVQALRRNPPRSEGTWQQKMSQILVQIRDLAGQARRS